MTVTMGQWQRVEGDGDAVRHAPAHGHTQQEHSLHPSSAPLCTHHDIRVLHALFSASAVREEKWPAGLGTAVVCGNCTDLNCAPGTCGLRGCTACPPDHPYKWDAGTYTECWDWNPNGSST